MARCEIILAEHLENYPLMQFFSFADLDLHLYVNTTGILTSPYYPSFYLGSTSRRWCLETLNNHRIHLKFLYLDIELDPACRNDYIMIQDSKLSEKQFYFCGITIPEDFKSSSNQVLIVFKSNEKNSRTGFKIQYSVVKGKKRNLLFNCTCVNFAMHFQWKLCFFDRKSNE